MKDFPRRIMDGSGELLSLEPARLLLAFREPVSRKRLENSLARLSLSLEPDQSDGQIPGERVNHSDQRLWVRSAQPIDEERYKIIKESLAQAGLDWIGPVYRRSGAQDRRGLLTPLPNVLVIKPRERSDRAKGASARDLVRAIAADGRAPEIREVEEKSRYLVGYRYFTILNPDEVNAYTLRERLLESARDSVADVQFETMPLIVPTAISPNDPLFPQQWNMTQIQAGGAGTTGWDISTGIPAVVVCVLDEGCDLAHPDLVFSDPGIRLDTMAPTGAPTGSHGTACAGIAAAVYDNAQGVAGVAGNSRIVPVAFVTWSDVEVANGITWANTTGGAGIISMSFGWNPWSHAIIDPAILAAFTNDVVMCVATHNYNSAITYPATNPLVMAVGASDEIDNRKSPASPDGEGWGSNFGPEISVVAPGVHIPTTDRLGGDGYDPGDYAMVFNGTSAATPHVAGLAALLRSAYPPLTSVQVRAIIERTADKVGAVAYADVAGYANGTWNQEMGYGRINVYRALDFADMLIRDAPADTGVEPFVGPNFWDFSDIVVRINDDNVFNPANPAQSRYVELGQPNYIYVQVTNNGPRDARNVLVSTRITPYVGLQFLYPQDWTLTDAMHVAPTAIDVNFPLVAAGATAMAKFRVETAQTTTLYGWQAGNSWHPCLLAEVTADNDYAFNAAALGGDSSPRRNNLAQRNLSVIDVLAKASAHFPFVAGHRLDREQMMSVEIDRSRLPEGASLVLALDDDGSAFPLVDFAPPRNGKAEDDRDDGAVVFLERTRLKTRFGACVGELTLERGSRFDCEVLNRLGKVTVRGGEVVLRDDRRYVDIRQPVVTVQLEKSPNAIYPLSLRAEIPASAEKGDQFLVRVAQKNARGATVGGATVIYVVR